MVIPYLVFLGLVAVERMFELALSRRNAAWAFSQSGVEHGRGHFAAMKLLHTGFFAACALEVVLLERPFLPWLGFPMLALAVGAQALRYSRSRYSTNDFDRGRRQRKVLMALWDQALTLDVVPRLPQLWLTMADSFRTDLPLEEVINLAYLGTTVERQHIRSKAIDANMTQSWTTPEGAAVLLPREDKIRAALESFYTPVGASELDTGNQVRIQVMNGWPRSEAEQLAAAALKWEGYKIVGTSLAERQDVAKTEIIVYNGDQALGEQIARLLDVPLTSVRLEPDPSRLADVQVILGADYNPCSR